MAAGSSPGQPTIRRWQRPEGEIQDLRAAVQPSVGGLDAAPSDDGELFDRLVDALEERVVAELERRGRRHSPGVF